MMEYKVMLNGSNYTVESSEENLEASALIAKALEIFYEEENHYKAEKEKYEIARHRIEKMFAKGNEEFGLKKVKNDYINVTFIPATNGKATIEKIMNQEKAKAILDELGIDEAEYMEVVEKRTNKRKESVRIGVN